MDESDFEGTIVREKLAEIGKAEGSFGAIGVAGLPRNHRRRCSTSTDQPAQDTTAR